MRFTLSLAFVICLFLNLGLTGQSYGQRAIAVQWNIPEDRTEALVQLDSLRKLGIRLLEIEQQPESGIWQRIDSLELSIYGSIPIKFPLPDTFSNPDSALLEKISNQVNIYSGQESVKAIGLFHYGAVKDPAFASAIQPLLSQIREGFAGDIYYTTLHNETHPVDSLTDFKMLATRIDNEYVISNSDSLSSHTGACIYQPGNRKYSLLTPFKEYLNGVSEREVPVFVTSDWLFRMLDKYPEFSSTVKLYNSQKDFLFPTPREQVQASFNHSWIVLLLVFIWGLFTVTHHLSPVYRKSLVRYFTGHVFFVEDILDRHIRSVGPVVVVLVQNILLTGITFYSLSVTFLSTTGLQALFHHYPLLLIFNHPLLSLFLLGCGIGIVLTVISILWIRLTNKGISQTRQVINLYAWPLQINFFIATLTVAFITAGSYPTLVLGMSGLFVLIFILAFVIAAVDTSKALKSNKGWFMTLSVGLYGVAWIGILFWIIQSAIPEVVQLALFLS